MTKKKTSAKKKLLPAAGMLAISATMLASSTYAWFTMNKEVSVTGMEVKAHAEEGLLVNEVKTAADKNWDDQATAGATDAIALRPASSADLVTFWHANSKKSSDEAGMDALTDTVQDAAGNYFANVTAGQTNISDYALVADTAAAGGSKAETHVYFSDASYGQKNKDDTNTTPDSFYDNGEGFYVKYTYYLKSSNNDKDLTVNNLQASVKAVKATASASVADNDLDKALRVGVAIPASSTSGAAIAGYKIFAPAGGEESYSVTGDAKGTDGSKKAVTATSANLGTATSYVQINKAADNTVTDVTIPKVTSDGIPVYVYVWFEGEDKDCYSDNLKDALAAFDITVNFKDADLG